MVLISSQLFIVEIHSQKRKYGIGHGIDPIRLIQPLVARQGTNFQEMFTLCFQ